MKDSRFRNRFVGALVLVSLAVIFIPMVLNGQGTLDMNYRGPAIPPEPDLKFPDKIIEQAVPTPAASPPPRVMIVENGTADENEAEAARRAVLPVPEAEVSIPEPETPAVPQKPEDIAAVARTAAAWAVQVGSFANKASAFTLRDKLRAKKFAAYVESVPTANGPVYRVRVGPELQQALAERLQARIAKDTGQKGIIVSHR